MEYNQSTTQQQHAATDRRHDTLKERIKRSMNKAGEATARRRSSVLAAASALASLAGGGGGDHKSTLDTVETTATNTQMVDSVLPTTQQQPTSKATDLFEERWMAASAAAAEDVPCTFPQKLMSVLDNDQVSDIITWLPHGKGFIILQKKRFASEVMPLYFKHSKFTSFTRKLNRWGFTRVTRGPESGAYYHKYFQKGNHHLCLQMHCQSKPNTNNSPRPSPSPPAVDVESPKIGAAGAPGAPTSPGADVTAELSALRVEGSPINIQDNNNNIKNHTQSFEATLIRQQELLRKDQEEQCLKKHMPKMLEHEAQQLSFAAISRQQELLRKEQELKEQEEQYRKKLMQDCLDQQDAQQQLQLAALYHSSRRSRNSPEKKRKQVEVPLNLPPPPPSMPSLASSSDNQQSKSLQSSLRSSATDPRFRQSLQSSLTASGVGDSLRGSWNSDPLHSSLTSSRTSMRDSWNTEPNPLPRMAPHPQRTGVRRGKQHHLQDIDWSKISNYSIQEERRTTLPDEEMVDQYRPSRPTPQEAAMMNRTSSMRSPPAYDTMLSDEYRRNALGLDSASSRHHRDVIRNALNALEASNDRAYLTMLMQRGHEKAQGRASMEEYVSQREVQSRIHAAMQAQMRQLEEHKQRMKSTAHAERRPADSMSQSRVDQLQQQMKNLSSNPGMYAAPTPPQRGNYVRRASAA